MNTTHDALIVPCQLTQPVRIERMDVDVDVLQELVGGNVESLAGADWHVYLNDEGGRLPQNHRAEVLMREAGADLDGTFKGRASSWATILAVKNPAPPLTSFGSPSSSSLPRRRRVPPRAPPRPGLGRRLGSVGALSAD